jgi:hypothetical protein
MSCSLRCLQCSNIIHFAGTVTATNFSLNMTYFPYKPIGKPRNLLRGFPPKAGVELSQCRHLRQHPRADRYENHPRSKQQYDGSYTPDEELITAERHFTP